MESPFHAGEEAIQDRAGVRDKVLSFGNRLIRHYMPDEHRSFFALLPWLLVGSLDGDGQPHASLLWGAPGFIRSPEPTRLRVSARPEADDPLAGELREGAKIGLLGIELPTRRRNRMNGRVIEEDSAGFTVAVEQSFGNCPKYIQARAWQETPRDAGLFEQGSGLHPRWLDWIARADTLFIASYNGDPKTGGVDVSHRGGPPGFVRLGADGRLWMPDYTGNFLFNTLGNLSLEPRCELLFIDFDTGDLLHLEARAELYWPEQFAALKEPVPAGADRLLALSPGRFRVRRARLPLSFSAPAASPFLPAQGCLPARG